MGKGKFLCEHCERELAFGVPKFKSEIGNHLCIPQIDHNR